MVQTIKDLSAMWETWIQSLDQEYPLKKGIFQYSTPVFFPGELHGWRKLVGYGPWSCKELNMTEQLTLTRGPTALFQFDEKDL